MALLRFRSRFCLKRRKRRRPIKRVKLTDQSKKPNLTPNRVLMRQIDFFRKIRELVGERLGMRAAGFDEIEIGFLQYDAIAHEVVGIQQRLIRFARGH